MSRVLNRARFAVLLLPAFLAGCYVVPIVPVGRPGYDRAHPGPYRGYDRGYDRGYHRGHHHGHPRGYYYRGGLVETPPAQQAGVTPGPTAHIDVASISR